MKKSLKSTLEDNTTQEVNGVFTEMKETRLLEI